MSGELVCDLPFGLITGKRLKTGGTAFLGVPYARPPAQRWSIPEALDEDYRFERGNFDTHAAQAAQPSLRLMSSIKYPELLVSPPEVGYSEECLTLDVYCPRATTASARLPVFVFIHGGVLQIGSPSCPYNAPHDLVDVDEPCIYVNITYRLGVFGFLTAKEPALPSNLGIRDQIEAVLFVQRYITRFGGDASKVTLAGSSAGAYCVQLLLHYFARQPGLTMPFQSAHMMSNGIAIQPKNMDDAQSQFSATCRFLKIDPEGKDVLDQLRSVPMQVLADSVGAFGGPGPYRAVTDGDIVASDLLGWQHSGGLAAALARKGFHRLLIGEMEDESLGASPRSFDHATAIGRLLYGSSASARCLRWSQGTPDSSLEQLSECMDAVMSSMQVYLGSRLLIQALWSTPGIHVTRYRVDWLPAKVQQRSTNGKANHTNDLPMWFHNLDQMTPEEAAVAAQLRRAVSAAAPGHMADDELVLTAHGRAEWQKDGRWQSMLELEQQLRPA